MAVPLVNDPTIAYATKVNIKFPGTQAQATAAESKGVTVTNDRLPSGVTIAVTGGTIKLAA